MKLEKVMKLVKNGTGGFFSLFFIIIAYTLASSDITDT